MVSAPDTEAERALIERARTDPDALATLYRWHVRSVHGFAYRRTGSVHLADEITSATFERAVRALPTFEWRGIGLRPWLLRIAANEVVELARRAERERGHRAQLAMRDLASAGTYEEALADGWARRDVVQRALDRLSPRFREVIELRYLAECSADDAATALGCSKGTLAAVLHRALRALRREIEREIGPADAGRAATDEGAA